MNRQKLFVFEVRIIYFLTFMILGSFIMVQFRAVNLRTVDLSDEKRYLELTQQIKNENELTESLNAAIENITALRDSLVKNTLNNSSSTMVEELRYVKILAGLVPAKGKGISVLLADSKRKTDRVEDALVHDRDILMVVNELKRAGAQAISVNDERIVSTSEIMCSGPTIQINKNKCVAPFEIKAIGNPEYLYSMIDESYISNELRSLDIMFEVKKSDKLIIPGYGGTVERLVTGIKEAKQ